MYIRRNPDTSVVEEVLKKLRENGGYCPCEPKKTLETKCMCKAFIEGANGMCRGGLFIKGD